MYHDCLSDQSGVITTLYNCQVFESKILCGCGVFKGGIKGSIVVSEGSQKYRIAIPEEATKTANYLTVFSQSDNLELEILPNDPRSKRKPSKAYNN